MARKLVFDPWRVRDEIATAAAKMIAEDGMDFASAKRKAAKQVVGAPRIAGEWLPNNEAIEDEVREYQSLFQSDSQPTILFGLRRIALAWMQRLAPFDPYLVGAVLNGTAGAHSDIQLQLFADAAKEVAIFLLNAGIDYEVSETRHFAGRDDVETLSFMVRPETVLGDSTLTDVGLTQVGMHLSLYSETDFRGALRGALGSNGRGGPARVNARGLEQLLAAATGDAVPASRTAPPQRSGASDA